MSKKHPENTEIYSYPITPVVAREKMISVNQQIHRIDKKIRKKTKRETCLICNASCSSFCHSHSIPRFVLNNIAEESEVSAPRQVDNLEPRRTQG